jgi:hypothetical protein
MGNDERPKMSWRDVDKRREGSSGGPRGSSSDVRPGSHEEHRQKQYRAALEAAYAKGELGKLADKLNIPGLNPAPPPRTTATATASPSSSNSDDRQPGSEAGESASGTDSGTDGGADSAAAPASSGAKKGGGRKKVEDERLALRRKWVEAAGRQEISRASEKYLARYPMPDDHELLEQLLEHEKEVRIGEAIVRIGELIDRRQPPRRSRALSGKLKYIIETTYDEALRQAAQNLLNRLT